MTLTLTPLPDFPLVKTGDDLGEMILASLAKANLVLDNNDILVVAQKVVSKAEGRVVDLNTVTPSRTAIDLALDVDKDARLVELILQESNEVVRQQAGVLIVEHKLGFICANAGIDRSNVAGSEEIALLLPEDPDQSAQTLRKQMEKASGKSLGVLIIDSHGRAWRKGTLGLTIGLAGMPGTVDKRGEKDMFGYELKVTEIGAADELAAGASLVMGQVDEATPVVHVRGFPYDLRDGNLKELLRDKSRDLFR